MRIVIVNKDNDDDDDDDDAMLCAGEFIRLDSGARLGRCRRH